MHIKRVALAWCICALGGAAFGYGVDGNLGLRSAERMSPTKIVLRFGPAVNAGVIPKKAAMFQVASPTDREFQLGVNAASAAVVKTEPDATYPRGWAGPRFRKITVEVVLPGGKPMKPKHRYWIRVNSAWVVGSAMRGKWIVAPGKTPGDDLLPRYGIRELSVVSPVVLLVTTGPGVYLKRLSDAAGIAVTSPDDPDFRIPVYPAKVGRRSSLDAYIPRGWPWKFLQRHDVFLVLDRKLKNGKAYTVDLNARPGRPVTCGRAKATLKLDDRRWINLAIKVNQYGYLPDATKYAYVGMWMGDLNACEFGPHLKSAEIRDAKTHAVVMRGTPALRRKATYRLVNGRLVPDPKRVKGPETVYKQDLSYEDVYQLDLSALNREGAYYLAVPGMGRSVAFRVAKDVYAEPFRVVMNGIFHQRCGIELKEPWTKHYRPACHRNKTEYSTFRRGVHRDPWKNLPKHATDGKTHDLWGGHHDAGDWNPRAHLEVAEILFLLYELNPGAFKDGQLNIPENKNGVPDVLDEAHWALDLWTRLQDKDGGVWHGIESNGDPLEGDAPATDRLREFAFAKDAAGSYWFAAVAAQAATIWKGLGRAREADAFLSRAKRAWDWAEKNGGGAEHDRHVFAAAMLLRATGERKYGDAFKMHSVYTKNPTAPPDQWKKYNQVYGSYYYATLPRADAKLRATIIAAFEAHFRGWERAAATTTYRYMRSPYAPNTWGTGGLPKWLVKPAMTMVLTRDAKLERTCRKWIALTCDFSLGCHPMNLVFTAGLGQRSIAGPWHHLMWNSPEGVIPGIQTEAAGGRWIAGQHPGRGGMAKWPGMSLYPPGPWPDLYKYSEFASPGMNEGVVTTQAGTAFAYGLLLPAVK